MIHKIVGEIFLIIGSIFMFLASLGLLRMPDVYNRMQTSTKAVTLGAISSILGVGIINPIWLPKCILIILFILFTNPVSAHAIGRAAYKRGVPLWKGSICDEYEKCMEEENE